MKTNIHFFITRSILLSIKSVSNKLFRKIKVQTSCSIFFSQNRAVYEIMWENRVEPNAIDDNRAYEHCMLDT